MRRRVLDLERPRGGALLPEVLLDRRPVVGHGAAASHHLGHHATAIVVGIAALVLNSQMATSRNVKCKICIKSRASKERRRAFGPIGRIRLEELNGGVFFAARCYEDPNF